MEFTQQSYNQLIEDVKDVLRILRVNSENDPKIKNCLVKDINTLFQYTYNIYNTTSHPMIIGAVDRYKQEYINATEELKQFRSKGLIDAEETELEEDKYWQWYFTFHDPDFEKWAAMTDSCTVRFYINPKISRFAEAIKEIVNTYYKITPTRRGLMVMKFPKIASYQTINRADKVVLYITEGDVVKFMEKRLAYLSKQGLFEKTIPLLTHKIADGVSESKTPTDRMLKRIPALWTEMFGKKFTSTSYGEYMTVAILGSLQVVLTHRKLRTMNDKLELDEIPKKDFEEIIDRIARNYVAQKAVAIITGKSLDILGIAA